MSKPPLRIILVGNYPPDGQTSMRAFAHMLRESLQSRGVDVLQTRPEATLGDLIPLRRARKWLGWFDKLAVYPPQLRRDLKRWRKTASDKTNARTIVHICDHSNAFYLPSCAPFPTLITERPRESIRGGR